MKNLKGTIWGMILIVVGVLLGLRTLDVIDFEIFFDGWWTLFIIVPCFLGVFNDNEKTGSLIGLVIGLLLLLACQGVLDFELLWKLLVPTIIVIFGLSLILKNAFNKEINDSIKKLNDKKNNEEEIFAAFSSQKVNFDKEEFKGKTMNAIFGGIKLDLRDAKFKDDTVINVTCVFGGADIYLPSDVKVKIKSNSIFGGVDEHKKHSTDDKAKVVYINATCIFGGVDIK